jgi:hypothetical protein
MARQLAVLQAALSSTTQSMIRCSPIEAFQVEVLDEMLTDF